MAKEDKLNEAQRQEAKAFYTDGALKLLRKAVGRGYKDAAHLKEDPDLAPLRQTAEFKKLLAELEAKGK